MRQRGTERLVCKGTKIQGSRKRWSSQRLSLKYGEYTSGLLEGWERLVPALERYHEEGQLSGTR